MEIRRAGNRDTWWAYIWFGIAALSLCGSLSILLLGYYVVAFAGIGISVIVTLICSQRTEKYVMSDADFNRAVTALGLFVASLGSLGAVLYATGG